MTVGYYRLYEGRPNLMKDIRGLVEFGCEATFNDHEEFGGSDNLKKLLTDLKEGDVLVSPNVYDLARSVSELCAILKCASQDGIRVVTLNDGLDSCSEDDGKRCAYRLLDEVLKLPLRILDHDVLLDCGLKNYSSMERNAQVINLYLSGFSVKLSCSMFRMGRSTFYRIFRKNRLLGTRGDLLKSSVGKYQ